MFFHRTDVLVSFAGEHAYRLDVDAASAFEGVSSSCTCRCMDRGPQTGGSAHRLPAHLLPCREGDGTAASRLGPGKLERARADHLRGLDAPLSSLRAQWVCFPSRLKVVPIPAVFPDALDP